MHTHPQPPTKRPTIVLDDQRRLARRHRHVPTGAGAGGGGGSGVLEGCAGGGGGDERLGL